MDSVLKANRSQAVLQERMCVSMCAPEAPLPSSAHTGSEVISLHCAVQCVLRGVTKINMLTGLLGNVQIVKTF